MPSNMVTYSWGDERVYIFANDISPKMNLVAQLEFELAY